MKRIFFKHFFFLIAILFGLQEVHGQLTAIQFEEPSLELQSIAMHQEYWKKLKQADQENQGSPNLDSINIFNLLWAASYFNKYGLPNKENLGKSAKAITSIWIHNRFPKIDKLTFPIIKVAYFKNWFDESFFREYYLRKIYKQSFEDKGYNSKPLPQLFEELELNLTDTIPIQKLINEFNQGLDFEQLPTIELGRWQAPTLFDTLALNGQEIIHQIDFPIIRIFSIADQGFYYSEIFSKVLQSFPVKLKNLETTNRLFCFADKISTNQFQITADGNLMIKGGQDKEDKIYNRID